MTIKCKNGSDKYRVIDINQVLNYSLDIVKNLINKSTERFTCHYAKDLPQIKGDFHQLEQVVINLVTNACQALENKEQGITIQTARDKDSGWITVTVQDEGVGIPKKNIMQITDPFFTTKRDTGGMGLGLAISSRIVKNHCGELIFHPNPEKGTIVHLKLPIYDQTKTSSYERNEID